MFPIRSLTFFLLSAPLTIALAAPAPAPAAPATSNRVARPPVDAATAMARMGGILVREAGGPRVVILNAQKEVPESAVEAVATRVQMLMRFGVTVRTTDAKDPMTQVTRELAKGTNEVSAVVLLAKSGDQPSLLVAPDDRWATINVDALAKGAKDGRLAERTQKELWRGIALAVGGAGSISGKCVLGPAVGLSGLDGLGHAPGVDALPRVAGAARRLGMQPFVLTTYRKAVEEGWAPQPTNDVQRAIWQEIKGKK